MRSMSGGEVRLPHPASLRSPTSPCWGGEDFPYIGGLMPFFSRTSEPTTGLPSGPLAMLANTVRPAFASAGLAGTMATIGVDGVTETEATPVHGVAPPMDARPTHLPFTMA